MDGIAGTHLRPVEGHINAPVGVTSLKKPKG
jgi:hypothetical protein